jgi:elongator complex protein 4
VIAEAVAERRLTFVEVGRPAEDVLGDLAQELASGGTLPVRICIPALGAPAWGDSTPHVCYSIKFLRNVLRILMNQGVLYFLHALRALLRTHTHGCASAGLAPHMSAAGWGGAGWVDKLGWAADGALTVAAFSGAFSRAYMARLQLMNCVANPALASMFPGHHGLLQTHRLPAPHTLGAPSDRFSTLRGLGGSGENNLAFRCTRKRLVFETLHLDVEGGTGERRTAPAGTTAATPRAKKESAKRVGFSADVYEF